MRRNEKQLQPEFTCSSPKALFACRRWSVRLSSCRLLVLLWAFATCSRCYYDRGYCWCSVVHVVVGVHSWLFFLFYEVSLCSSSLSFLSGLIAVFTLLCPFYRLAYCVMLSFCSWALLCFSCSLELHKVLLFFGLSMSLSWLSYSLLVGLRPYPFLFLGR